MRINHSLPSRGQKGNFSKSDQAKEGTALRGKHIHSVQCFEKFRFCFQLSKHTKAIIQYCASDGQLWSSWRACTLQNHKLVIRVVLWLLSCQSIFKVNTVTVELPAADI